MSRILSCLLVVFAAACGGRSATPVGPTPPSQTNGSWGVKRSGEIVEIAYGSGASFPQYAALHTSSGYLRMTFGLQGGWSASVVLPPAFWSNGIYYQGAPTAATWTIDGADLDVAFTSRLGGLGITGHVRLSPPAQDSLSALVSVVVSGSVALDARPNEAFKPVMLSSMHVSPTVWDASAATVEGRTVAIPEEGWILQPAVEGRVFGLLGGSSAWKTNSPSIEITMDRALPVTGWVTRSANPNDDNVGLWAASDFVAAYQFRVRAYRQ